MKRLNYFFATILLLVACSDNEPAIVRKDFNVQVEIATLNQSVLSGKPVKFKLTISDLDKNNKDEIKTFFGCDTGNGEFIYNGNVIEQGAFILNDYISSPAITFDYTPDAAGVHEIYVKLQSPALTKTDTITLNVQALSVAVTSTTGGTVTASREYNYKEQAVITAVPNEGYSFIGWFENGLLASQDLTYSFTVEKNVIIEARFSINTFEITALTVGGGNVLGTREYEYGEQAAITAVPNEGYLFTGWFENGVLVSQDKIHSFTVIKSRTLEARFDKAKYLLEIVSSTGGTANGGGSYNHGTVVPLTAISDANFRFVGWFKSGNLISESSSFNYTVTSNTTINAVFENLLFTYTLRFQTDNDEYYENHIDFNPSSGWGGAFEGTNIEFSVNYPPRGSQVNRVFNLNFDGWFENGEFIGSTSYIKVQMPKRNTTYYAKFSRNKYFARTEFEGVGEKVIVDGRNMDYYTEGRIRIFFAGENNIRYKSLGFPFSGTITLPINTVFQGKSTTHNMTFTFKEGNYYSDFIKLPYKIRTARIIDEKEYIYDNYYVLTVNESLR